MDRLTCAQTRHLLAAHTVEPGASFDELAVERHLVGCAPCRRHQQVLATLPAAMHRRLAPPLRPHPHTAQVLYREVVTGRPDRRLRLPPWRTVRRLAWRTLRVAAELAAVLVVSQWVRHHLFAPPLASLPPAALQDSVPAPPDTVADSASSLQARLDSVWKARAADTLLFPDPSAPVPPAGPR